MRLRWMLSFLLAAAAPARAAEGVSHHELSFEGARVNVVHVPRGLKVVPVVANPGQTLEAFVQKHKAVAGINGGYFNYSDGAPVSHVRLGGNELTAPERNHDLIKNPVLKPVMKRILQHRAEWRRTAEGSWEIAFHDGPGTAIDALQAGPRLLPGYDPVAEGFVIKDKHGKVVRDGIGTSTRATRSGVGVKADGSLILVTLGAPGLSLPAFARLLKQQGATSALNLDGGKSTGLAWYEGGRFLVSYHGKHPSAPIHSALLVFAP